MSIANYKVVYIETGIGSNNSYSQETRFQSNNILDCYEFYREQEKRRRRLGNESAFVVRGYHIMDKAGSFIDPPYEIKKELSNIAPPSVSTFKS